MEPSKAQISRAAINRLHIAMKHLFLRGGYKPLGVSGESMINAMKALQPEIYGSINDPGKVEIDGLLYIFQRLPQGIESTRFINLIGREGYEDSAFKPIIPAKRRRNCYRIDANQMYVEMTRGRSDIYDILTHLTFMYIEAEKIRTNALDVKGRPARSWSMLKSYLDSLETETPMDQSVGFTYLSQLLGRTFEETKLAVQKFESAEMVNSLFSIVYNLGKLSMDEYFENNDREISFSSTLRETLGHHIYSEIWANTIKAKLVELELIDRPIHLISANMHSVLNSLYGRAACPDLNVLEIDALATKLATNKVYQQKVYAYALKHGMINLDDHSGTNISVQIIDLSKLNIEDIPVEIRPNEALKDEVIIVMDYAFGEQAYETMDEILKPFIGVTKQFLDFKSINIMGKAGILLGGKGDIMIPNAHIFEGSADNYAFDNKIDIDGFQNQGLTIVHGAMVTVLGTSLQNKDILRYFLKSSWKVIGLEMEGAHYQKAIQAASKIRKSISENVDLRYAYYASDNPLETGATLASGSLGQEGIKPTYLITKQILKGILQNG